MRAVVQRVLSAKVTVDGETVGEIAAGLCVLVGVAVGDTVKDAEQLALKVANLRIFEDEAGKMNLSALQLKHQLLAVSQFTLLGDTRRGNRPGFSDAMEPIQAKELFFVFCEECRKAGLSVETGRFQADMQVALVNNGPVTLLVDTQRVF